MKLVLFWSFIWEKSIIIVNKQVENEKFHTKRQNLAQKHQNEAAKNTVI